MFVSYISINVNNVNGPLTPGSAGGVSLAAVQQAVTELIINATVAEQVAQRTLDTLENSVRCLLRHNIIQLLHM